MGRTTGARFSLTLLSAVAAKGQLRFTVTDERVNGPVFCKFLRRLLHDQEGPVLLIVDGHPSHQGAVVREFVAGTNGRLRLFFLPASSPELTPDESVWRPVKTQRVGRHAITGPDQLRKVGVHTLRRLQRRPQTVRGFFYAPNLRYVVASVG